MTTKLTPLGRTPSVVKTIVEPTYSLSEQGGFRDAEIIASVKDLPNLRLADVDINGAYLGDVRSIVGQTITVQGKQTPLDSIFHGRVYTTSTWENWENDRNPLISASVDVSATTNGTLVFTWAQGTYFKAGAFNAYALNLPESQAITYSFDYAWAGTVTAPHVRTWDSGGNTDHTAASGTVTGTTSATTFFSISAYNANAMTPAADVTLTISNMRITHTAGATVQAVIGDICDMAGLTLVPMREIDTTVSHTFDELVFPANTSLLAMLGTITAHGDWYLRFEPRLSNGQMVSCLCFGPRSTVPEYTIKEDGQSVVVQFDSFSVDPLASVARCLYRNSYGLELFVDVQDTDTSHYLVDKGITKMVTLDTGQSTSAAAAAIGTRYLADAGRDQYKATVTISGSPNGRKACRHTPGPLVTLDTWMFGSIVVRITDGQYQGETNARITVDSTPDLAARLALWKDGSVSAASRGSSLDRRVGALSRRQSMIKRQAAQRRR